MLELLEKCGLVFCLPLTREDFFNEVAHPRKDFVKLFDDKGNREGDWTNYYQTVIDPYMTFRNYFLPHGLMIIDSVSFDNFVTLVNSQLLDVIILLTHCKDGGDEDNEALEFFDRMVASKEILATPFKSYPLILDISVCNPHFLKTQMPKYYPEYACFSSEELKDLPTWLLIYTMVFSAMQSDNITFLPAFTKVFQQYF